MQDELTLSRSDLGVLFWVVGCRTGAKLEEIIEHEGHCHRKPPSNDEIGESLLRLAARRLIYQTGDRYVSDPKLQAAFMNQCQNSRDTVEEIEILRRLIATMD